MADANDTRDWRIYGDLAGSMIAAARRLYADEPLDVDLKESVYALDATTIDLCMNLFPWAHFRSTKSAVKLHTLLDRNSKLFFLFAIRLSDWGFYLRVRWSSLRSGAFCTL